MRICLLFILCLSYGKLTAQSLEDQISGLNQEVKALEQQKMGVLGKIEDLKFKKIQRDLDAVQLPKLQAGDVLVRHSALALAYCEEHEQARWVAHIILPDIITGTVFRSNDFRPDPDVPSGSAVETDYFLTSRKPDSTLVYDGFGYDRGHLAPSADFRWSQKALSESYFYSNMSPQLGAFNRDIWGDVEDQIRGYIFRNKQSQLYVVTGPVLSPDLPVIQRGVNQVSIPRQYWKIALDLEKRRAIGVIMPNQAITDPIANFAVTIDQVEALTGLDFFSKLPDSLENALESQLILDDWFPKGSNAADVQPLRAPELPRNHFNTTQAKLYINKKDQVDVCGTVVSARRSKNGNILMNLDKQFPNQVFTVFIKKENIPNFSYDPEQAFKNKSVCVHGRVIDLDGVPAMFIENENAVKLYGK
ncbi:MAG: DNA/RNA non-specific endonuclease [Bacteroidetes bacterium]|nr:DNA/RNA non-specific endonuclease [Bacteroidota bacterium]